MSLFDKYVYLSPINKKIKLRILFDRTSLEVFGNDGQVSMSFCFLPDSENKRLSIYAFGGSAYIISMNIYELNSIWL
ncbi:MAG: GH32 C-terminal domain-containing protein [bacterium]